MSDTSTQPTKAKTHIPKKALPFVIVGGTVGAYLLYKWYKSRSSSSSGTSTATNSTIPATTVPTQSSDGGSSGGYGWGGWTPPAGAGTNPGGSYQPPTILSSQSPGPSTVTNAIPAGYNLTADVNNAGNGASSTPTSFGSPGSGTGVPGTAADQQIAAAAGAATANGLVAPNVASTYPTIAQVVAQGGNVGAYPASATGYTTSGGQIYATTNNLDNLTPTQRQQALSIISQGGKYETGGVVYT